MLYMCCIMHYIRYIVGMCLSIHRVVVFVMVVVYITWILLWKWPGHCIWGLLYYEWIIYSLNKFDILPYTLPPICVLLPFSLSSNACTCSFDPAALTNKRTVNSVHTVLAKLTYDLSPTTLLLFLYLTRLRLWECLTGILVITKIFQTHTSLHTMPMLPQV